MLKLGVGGETSLLCSLEASTQQSEAGAQGPKDATGLMLHSPLGTCGSLRHLLPSSVHQGEMASSPLGAQAPMSLTLRQTDQSSAKMIKCLNMFLAEIPE